MVANHRFKGIRHVIRKAAKYNHHNPEQVLSTALARSDALRKTGKNGQSEMNEVLLSPIAEIPEAEAETVDSQTEEGQGKEEDKQRDGRGDKRRLEEEREEEEGEAFVTKVNQEGFLDFVKDPDMRFLTLTMLYIW